MLRASISSRRDLSSDACCSASRIIRSISFLSSDVEPLIVIFCSLPVAMSFAVTFKMPFASISNVTSTCGSPRGAGAMPSSRNWPSVRLSRANSRSPCNTWMSTADWLSSAVEKTSVFRVGIVELRSISLVITPPSVSTPRLSGVTSSSSTSFTSPVNTPAWIAAPIATTSSGLTDWFGSLPLVNLFTSSLTAGMRVDPPTRITSSRSLSLSLASAIACLTGFKHRSTRSCVNCSNFERVNLISKCLGPPASAVMNGRLISVSNADDNSIFAFSAASVSRCNACRSLLRSIPWSFLNSSANQSTIRLSKSSPPRCVSPAVLFTSKTPSPTSRMETSKVPPPRSKTRMVSCFFLSNP